MGIATMFAAQLAAGLAGGAGFGFDWRAALLTVNVAIWVAILAAAWVGLPGWVGLVGIIGPPVAALIYLGVCHGAITRLCLAYQVAARYENKKGRLRGCNVIGSAKLQATSNGSPFDAVGNHWGRDTARAVAAGQGQGDRIFTG